MKKEIKNKKGKAPMQACITNRYMRYSVLDWQTGHLLVTLKDFD